MESRVLVLNSGIHHEAAFKWMSDPKPEYLYAAELKKESLLKSDIVIVPFHTDQIALHRHRGKLESFVKKGGVLVILGATQEGDLGWLPFCRWKTPFSKVLKIDKSTSDGSIIFKDIEEPEALRFHRDFFAHGTLLPGFSEDKISVLGRAEKDSIVMFVRRCGFKGSLFCTTLDPDYHSVSEVPDVDEQRTTQDRAAKLLENIINWAILEAKGKSPRTRRLRRLEGYLGGFVNGSLFLLMLIFPVTVGLYFLLSERLKYQAPAVEAGLATLGLIEFAATIIGLSLERRQAKKE